ncbi:MAG: HD domain-containing phosphohydrolase [Thermodesulfobacteriota bacterium]
MKILIADDELVSRKKMEKLIQTLGHEPILAMDGVEAWDLWKSNRIRIVITDWLMPGLDGCELCRRIREIEGGEYTYLIMVTAKSDLEDLVVGMEAGADDFIVKPFNKEELAVRIRAGERVLSLVSRDIVIFSMAKLAESRDPETGNHLDRIRHYCKVLAETMTRLPSPPPGIDNAFVDNIFLTSPLHDIGKIGIPDYILLKPGRFDNQEFENMKQHCRIGFETLNEALIRFPKADYLRMSAEIALSHHEKWDGTGYPNQLKGTSIPISARIVALADVYDALASKRVYKSSYNHQMVRAIIMQERGTHFDPQVVDAFLASEDRFVEIFDQFRDK